MLVLWVILLPLAIWGVGRFTASLVTGDVAVDGSQSQQAADLIHRRFPNLPPETDMAVLHSDTLKYGAPAFRTQIAKTVTRFTAVSGVTAVTDPATDPAGYVSADRHTVLVPIAIRGDAGARQKLADTLKTVAGQESSAQIGIQVTGTSPISAASIVQSNHEVSRSDSIALPVAAVVLVIAFGSFLAALLPLALGGIAMVTAFGLLGALSQFMSFDVFTRTAVAMLSIALGIDYALLMITRFREELAAEPVLDRPGVVRAVGRTVATAGHAVAFSATAVMVSLSGLFLVRTPRVRGMAFGTISAVASMLVLALTLLPAVLSLLGPRINALALPWARRTLAHPDLEHSVWARIADFSLRRPLAVVAVCLVVLLGLAWPAMALRYGVADQVGSVADTAAGRGYDLMAKNFPAGTTSPVQLVVARSRGTFDGSDLNTIARISATMASDPQAAAVSSVTTVLDQNFGGHDPARLGAARLQAGAVTLGGLINPAGNAAVVSVTPRNGVSSSGTSGLVDRMRARAHATAASSGLTMLVGGSPALIVDSAAENSRATPLVIAAVLAAAAVVLLVAFRSLLLPIKAVLMNLLTVAAAFGAMVLVFQQGHGAAMLGLNHDGFIQVFVPLITFTLVFGLSMDYEVFMLTRMQEAWRATGDNVVAVRTGIVHTARVITAAAAIMVAVFGSFTLASVTDVQQMGFMLALAVLIDASIVRLFLVPALMRLMGRWNWWFPGRS